MSAVAFVASPLLGPAVWTATAAALGWRGRPAVMVPSPPRAPRRPDDVVEHLVTSLGGRDALVLVAHSNAGLYVPLLGTRLPLVAAVLADAALAPERGSAPLAPPGAVPALQAMADGDGLLPPWTRWWAEEETAALFPDAAARAAVEREQHRLPLAYFSAEVPVPDGWTARPAAYLRFSDAYVGEQERATGWGWPVATLAGTHLHPLADPEGTAAAIADLLGRLGVAAERPGR